MIVSPERLAANKANAAKSTGPKTEAGKEVSRRNALKHGMTGDGLALPDEDAAEVAASFDRFARQMKPKTEIGRKLVFRVALMTLRLERFAEAEAATLSDRVADAGALFGAGQLAARDEAYLGLAASPSTQMARLASFPEGIDRLVDSWSILVQALSADRLAWGADHFVLFEALLGRVATEPSAEDSRAWNFAARGDLAMLNGPRLPGVDVEGRLTWAWDRMLDLARSELARWVAHKDAFDSAPIARARANAIKKARYDGSPEGLIAKKYEATTSRELYKALKEFRTVEAEFAGAEPDDEPEAETLEPAETSAELASFFPETTPAPETPPPSPEVATIRAISTFPAPTSDRSEGRSASISVSEAGQSRRL